MVKVNAVFDIGKTNKKFFLFDEEYNEVYRDYVNLPLTADEDGFETENLETLRDWIKETFDAILDDERFDIKTLNFSSYGASLVHLDYKGKPLTPLYNYTKDLPQEIIEEFYKEHGDALIIGAETASPPSGMLNSGMQLYWIKKTKPAFKPEFRSRPISGGSGSGSDPDPPKIKRLRLRLRLRLLVNCKAENIQTIHTNEATTRINQNKHLNFFHPKNNFNNND